MLNKSSLRKKAYQLIRQQRVDHQSAYDELKKLKSDCPKAEVAEIVSKIPSDAVNQKTFGVRIAFVICLVIVFLIRLLDFVAAWYAIGGYEIFIFLFHGLVLPTLGIVSALTSRFRFYKLVAVFMFLASIGTVITAIRYSMPFVLLFAAPFVAAGILGFIIPSKLKVPYKKRMVQRELQGRTVNVYEYFFTGSQRVSHEGDQDLLDL